MTSTLDMEPIECSNVREKTQMPRMRLATRAGRVGCRVSVRSSTVRSQACGGRGSGAITR